MTSPDLGSSGRACARGSRTSTPPCMMGAVIMKMMSSTNATSTSEVTLMSALSGSSPWPRSPPPPPSRPATLQPPLARHGADDLLREPFELAGEQPQPIDEQVVRHHGRDGDGEPSDGGDQRFRDARSDRGDVARAAEGDADEGVHHARSEERRVGKECRSR